MAVYEKHKTLISLKLDMLEEEKCRLFVAVENYISGVKDLAQSFVNHQNGDDCSFIDVSQATESALTILTKESEIFRMLEIEKSNNPIGTEVNARNTYDSSCSLSFEVLSHLPSRSLVNNISTLQLSKGHITDRMEILEREMTSYSSKTDSLISRMPSILEDLSYLKKQVTSIAATKEPSIGLLRLAKDDDRITHLETSLSTIKTSSEEGFKHHGSLIKELSTSLALTGQHLHKFEVNLNDLENQEKTADLRSRDMEKRLSDLEENEQRRDSLIRTIETRSSSTDGLLKEFDKKLVKSHEVIKTLLSDRDRGRLAVIKQLQDTIDNLQIIRRECNERTEKNDAQITHLLLRLRAIEEREGNQNSFDDPSITFHQLSDVNSMNEPFDCEPQPCTITEISCEGPKQAKLMKVGARVRRGPDWACGDVDGPAPGLGTVTSTDRLEDGLVMVKWDNGHKDFYQMGLNDLYQLQLVDMT